MHTNPHSCTHSFVGVVLRGRFVKSKYPIKAVFSTSTSRQTTENLGRAVIHVSRRAPELSDGSFALTSVISSTCSTCTRRVLTWHNTRHKYTSRSYLSDLLAATKQTRLYLLLVHPRNDLYLTGQRELQVPPRSIPALLRTARLQLVQGRNGRLLSRHYCCNCCSRLTQTHSWLLDGKGLRSATKV